MIAAAVIVGPDGGLSPLTQLGGLSLLKRAVLTLQKAGITTCYVCLEPDREDLQRELQNDERVHSRVVWLGTNPRAIPTTEPESTHLMFTVDTVFRHPLIVELSRQVVPGTTVTVTDASRVPALALMPAVRVPEVLTELAQGKALHNTTALADSDQLQLPAARGHFVRRLLSPTSLSQIEHELLLSLENPRDGYVDTYCNRKLSRVITRWLVCSPLSPNQITVLSCLVGLLGALCFFPGGYWGPLLGALLLQFSVVLDCCDGEVARVKFMESPLGDWLDIVCDTVVHLAIFLGIGIAVWRDGTTSHALPLAGLLALGGFLAFPLVTLAEKTEAAGDRRGGWEDALIKRLLASLTTRDFSVVILASALLGQLSWFLWGAAIGAHIFWLTLAWLLFRAGRFGKLRRVGKKSAT
jgi:phosphatidylglycerophosphate synthase